MCCLQSWNLVQMEAKYCRSVNDQLSTMPHFCLQTWSMLLSAEMETLNRRIKLQLMSYEQLLMGVFFLTVSTSRTSVVLTIMMSLLVRKSNQQMSSSKMRVCEALHQTQLLLYFLRELCCNEMSWLCQEACQRTVFFFSHTTRCCIGFFGWNYNWLIDL